MENDSFLLSCIAAAIINVENDINRNDNLGRLHFENVQQESIPNDMVQTYVSALEGLLHMLEGESAFLDMTASLQLERFHSFIIESKDTRLIFKSLDHAYKILTSYMNENISDTQIKFVQIGLIHLGRLMQIRERDVLGRLGAQLESEMNITTKQGQYYVETVLIDCNAFIEESLSDYFPATHNRSRTLCYKLY